MNRQNFQAYKVLGEIMRVLM